MWQLGFVSAVFPDLCLEDIVSVAVELGYDCIELMCWPDGMVDRKYSGVKHVDVSEIDEKKAKAIETLMGDNGVTISALGYYPNLLSPEDAEAEKAIAHIHRVIDAAAMLNVNLMNTFIGRDWTKSVDDNWPKVLDKWGPLVEYAQAQDVKIGIENCPMLFTNDEWPGGKNLAISPAVWRRMFAAMPSPYFGLNYDPSHLVWQQMDYTTPLKEFSDRIFHVHAKDVRVDRCRLNDVGILATPLEYHLPKLPGLGDIDWGDFFSVLGDVRYRGAVCVEVEDHAYEDSFDSRKSALRQSCTYLRNYIPIASTYE